MARHLHTRKSRWFLTGSLTPDFFFGHNLCFKCLNGWCEPILDIYVLIAFQWYKELFKSLGFDPCNHSLNIWESIGTLTPNMGVHLGVWGFFPSHCFALPGHENATSGFSLGPHPCKPFCLGRKPKAKVTTLLFLKFNIPLESIVFFCLNCVIDLKWGDHPMDILAKYGYKK